ncbi:MAG: GntR family transcriptional regulator [Anaerolineales bacterium]|nr:GntR family transcriptional regulator [Anaerolineales bacterium]
MKLSISPIRPKRLTLSDDVAKAISDAILSGELESGQRVTETEVADWLGVSRTPVREAFSKLERQTLLKKDTSRSYVVSSWTKDDFLELAQLRSALEALVIELIIPKISEEDYEYLEAIISQMESAIHREDYDRLMELDIQFHSSLWQISDHSRLLQVFNDLKTQIIFFMTVTRPGDETDYPDTHRALLKAIKEGDKEQARLEVMTHILSTAKRAISRFDNKSNLANLA